MRKKYIIPALICAVCLTLSGCQDQAEQPGGNETTASVSQTAEVEKTTAAEETVESSEAAGTNEAEETVESTENSESTENVELEITESTGIAGGLLPGVGETEAKETIMVDETGKVRIDYTTNRSSVQYITSASMLPDYEELKGYDDAYFKDHALVLVIDTVNSGSVKVDIDSITIVGSKAEVTLSREMSGDVGTADMATWLLWAEIETGLEYEWSVANPGVKPSGEAY